MFRQPIGSCFIPADMVVFERDEEDEREWPGEDEGDEEGEELEEEVVEEEPPKKRGWFW